MAAPRKLNGHCHCGLVRFSLTVPEFNKITTCRCTYCIKSGITWNHPNPKISLVIEQGEDKLTKYEFGAKKNTHYFCPHCGSTLLALDKGKEEWGVNVRMLDNVDWQSMDSDEYPGADLPPHYEPPIFPSAAALGDIAEGEKMYHGNCHCKIVRYTVKTQNLDQQDVMRCNCSLCSRNGDYFIYPPASSVVLEGKENLTGYAFVDAKSLRSFCKICGSSVCVQVLHAGQDLMPLNVRCFDGADLEKLKYKEYDGAKNKPHYQGKAHLVCDRDNVSD